MTVKSGEVRGGFFLHAALVLSGLIGTAWLSFPIVLALLRKAYDPRSPNWLGQVVLFVFVLICIMGAGVGELLYKKFGGS